MGCHAARRHRWSHLHSRVQILNGESLPLLFIVLNKKLFLCYLSIILIIQPALSSKLKIHDTCGVNNLHGMPGILAALAGAVAAALSSKETWGNR